ncbi:ParA family protein [Haladaptatus sp. DYF46]|uniref:ParA family protein n=1 Tax=Haladaptatus sp. DYF46 TaxID=2886041 RepID=UPI002103F3D2|nr:ParA family protein [Haladaptatus sp. DYF46]
MSGKNEATRIAVTNQKGGVGKTMVAINLAGALAHRGHDILFADIDPQGNGTEGVGLATAYEEREPNAYTMFSDIEESPLINDLIREGSEFDVLPSNIDLFNVEYELMTSIRTEERLSIAFDELDTEYDFIVVDCPPNLGVLTDNAMLACRNIVIPALAESTSIRALELLTNQVESLESGYDIDVTELALVANRVENDGEADEMMQWFEDTYAAHLPVFEIRKRVALKRAWDAGVSTFEHDEACDMAAEFDSLAEHIEEVA